MYCAPIRRRLHQPGIESANSCTTARTTATKHCGVLKEVLPVKEQRQCEQNGRKQAANLKNEEQKPSHLEFLNTYLNGYKNTA